MLVLICPACGYGLHANESPATGDANCPRCGKPVPSGSSSAAPQGETRVFGPKQWDTPAVPPRQTSPGETPNPPETIVGNPAPTPTSLHSEERFNFLKPPEAEGEIGWLAHYRVIRLLGTGGMGMVFCAEDTHLQRIVALKVVRPEMAHDSELRQRFLREARTTAAVKSDHIVTIYQVGQDDNLPYLAMELLDGESLEDALHREAQPDIDFVIRVGREVALGLAAAHQRGLVHRDIKPANIFLEAPGGRVKILDFGLARRSAMPSDLTQPGLIMGTPDYMSPEQAEGADVSERSDLFSLGCVLYRLLTGKRPFGEGSTMAVLRAVALTDPPPLRVVNPDVPPALADLVTQLMAKAPENRPPSASAVAAALETMTGGPVTRTMSGPTRRTLGTPPPVASAPPSKGRQRRAGWIALAVIGVLIGAVVPFLATRDMSPAPVAMGTVRTSPKSKASTGPGSLPVSNTARTTGPTDPPTKFTLNGGGSTLISPLLDKWASTYRKETDVRINYVATGSGNGIQQLTAQALDFACSEAPLTEEQLKQARQSGGDVLYVPVALGGIVPAYNLEGLKKPLRFSGSVLAGIYLGDIRKWNDAALAEINPGVDLPDKEIVVIHRLDSSGSTYIFSDFLSKVSKDWQKKFGSRATIEWPVGVGARGNEGMVEALKRKPGSIAYVELLHALQSKLKFGLVKNKAGNYIEADLNTVVTTAEGIANDVPADLRLSLTYAPGKEAYPICGCTWAIIYTKQPEGKGQRLVEFLRWVTQEGQEYNTDLYYARLPAALADRVQQRLKEVKFGE